MTKKKVVDLHPDKPTPRKILEDLLDSVENIESIVVLIKQTDGGVRSDASYMSVEERALLTKLNEFEMFQCIMDCMDNGPADDDEDGT
jgi:hypothetical protein